MLTATPKLCENKVPRIFNLRALTRSAQDFTWIRQRIIYGLEPTVLLKS
jgi:hypothetical protein